MHMDGDHSYQVFEFKLSINVVFIIGGRMQRFVNLGADAFVVDPCQLVTSHPAGPMLGRLVFWITNMRSFGRI